MRVVPGVRAYRRGCLLRVAGEPAVNRAGWRPRTRSRLASGNGLRCQVTLWGAKSRPLHARLLDLIFVRLTGWLVFLGRSPASKDAELLVLRHELTMPRQTQPRRRMGCADRAVLAALINEYERAA